MANPQPDIYIKYSKELFSAKMRFRLSGQQNQFFEAILYLSYGNNPPRKLFPYSGKVISELTGLSRVEVSKIKRQLINMLVINVTKKGNNFVEMIGINKNYDDWKVLPKKVMLPKKVTNVTQKGNKKSVLPIIASREENIRCVFADDEPPHQLARLLFKLIFSRNSNFKKPNFQVWAKHIDLMIRVDKRKPETIGKVIRWSQQDTFWQNNILSTSGLRKNFDRLFMKMAGNGSVSCSSTYRFPTCPHCKTQGDNIEKGQSCPFCGKVV